MTIDSQTGLVLEGGGMRGVFTCGALDYLMDRGLHFRYCVAVSAGACNGLSYISQQRGRAKQTNIDLLEKYHYIGMKYFWSQHSILDQDMIYYKIPLDILPFDFEAFFRDPYPYEMVTTNCLTGRPCYLTETQSAERLTDIAKASSSLPFVCPIVHIDGVPMLDGGIVDSIPLMRAIETGHSFNVVILTRERGFRDHNTDIKIPKFIYRQYPRLRAVLSRRHACYNEQLEMVDHMEAEGRILAIRPLTPPQVSRLEHDPQKLIELYEQGYEAAKLALQNVSIQL